MLFPQRQFYRPGGVRATDRRAAFVIPAHSRYVIIGAGIHGLSTAWHLARELRARGLGGGRDQHTYKHSGPRAGVPGHATSFTPANDLLPPTATKEMHSLNA